MLLVAHATDLIMKMLRRNILIWLKGFAAQVQTLSRGQ
jgi:hypothetical protein